MILVAYAFFSFFALLLMLFVWGVFNLGWRAFKKTFAGIEQNESSPDLFLRILHFFFKHQMLLGITGGALLGTLVGFVSLMGGTIIDFDREATVAELGELGYILRLLPGGIIIGAPVGAFFAFLMTFANKFVMADDLSNETK